MMYSYRYAIIDLAYKLHMDVLYQGNNPVHVGILYKLEYARVPQKEFGCIKLIYKTLALQD